MSTPHRRRHLPATLTVAALVALTALAIPARAEAETISISSFAAIEPPTNYDARASVPLEWKWWPAGRLSASVDLGDGECMADGVGCTAIEALAVEVYLESSTAFNCPQWVLFEVADAEAGPYRPVAKVEPNWTCTADKDFELISAEGLHTRGDWVRVTVRSATTGLLGLGDVIATTSAGPIADPAYLPSLVESMPATWELRAVAPFDELGAELVPTAEVSPTRKVAPGERAHFAFAVWSPAAMPQTFAVAAQWQGPGLPAVMTRARTVDTADFIGRADVLMPNGGTLMVRPRTSGHLFWEVEVPPGTPPGIYTATLTLTPSVGPAQSQEVEVEVVAADLPAIEEMESLFFDWHNYGFVIDDELEGAPTDAAIRSRRAELRERYGQNAHQSFDLYDPNERGLDESWTDVFAAIVGRLESEANSHPQATSTIVNLKAHKATFNSFRESGSEAPICPGDPGWAYIYKEMIRQMDDAVAPKDLIVYPIDEPSPLRDVTLDVGCAGSISALHMTWMVADVIQQLNVEEGRAIKVMTYPLSGETPVEDPNTPDEVDSYRELTPVIDIWVANKGIYDTYHRAQNNGDPISGVVEFFVDDLAGATVWFYNGEESSYPHADAYRRRLLPWILLEMGWTGYGYWNFYNPVDESEGGSVWTSRDGSRADYATVYATGEVDPLAPIDALAPNFYLLPSRRMAALRQGIDDYRIGQALGERIAACAADTPAGCATSCALDPDFVVDQAVGVVYDAANKGLADLARVALLGELARLNACMDGLNGAGSAAPERPEIEALEPGEEEPEGSDQAVDQAVDQAIDQALEQGCSIADQRGLPASAGWGLLMLLGLRARRRTT